MQKIAYPCPFCDGDVETSALRELGTANTHERTKICIQCKICKVMMQAFSGNGEQGLALENLIDRWNKRAEDNYINRSGY